MRSPPPPRGSNPFWDWISERRQTTYLLFSTWNWSGWSNLRSGSIFVSLCAVRENVWEPVKLGLISGYSGSTSRLTLPPALICTSQKQAVNKSWNLGCEKIQWTTIAPTSIIWGFPTLRCTAFLLDFCCEASRVTVIFPSNFLFRTGLYNFEAKKAFWLERLDSTNAKTYEHRQQIDRFALT